MKKISKEKYLDPERTKIIAERLSELFGDESAPETSRKLGNISAQSVNYWKTGANRPDFDMLLRICDIYDATADWILGRESAVRRPEKGMAAACECTGFDEGTIKIIQQSMFSNELELLIRDETFKDFISNFSNIGASKESLCYCMEDTEKALEEKGDTLSRQELLELRSELRDAMDMVDFRRFRFSEAATRSADSVYALNAGRVYGQQLMDQLNYELVQAEKRR